MRRHDAAHRPHAQDRARRARADRGSAFRRPRHDGLRQSAPSCAEVRCAQHFGVVQRIRRGRRSCCVGEAAAACARASGAAPASSCLDAKPGTDAVCGGGSDALGTCKRVGRGSVGNHTQASCCALCDATSGCGTWVLSTKAQQHGPAVGTCFLLAHGTVTATKKASGRVLGGAIGGSPPGPSPAHITGLRAQGVLQAASSFPLEDGGWHWAAWDTAAGTTLRSPASRNHRLSPR